MPPPAEKKIVNFPSEADIAKDFACEACGLQRQTASLCRVCAFRLVDIALSSSAEGGIAHEATLVEAADPFHSAVQLRYDHYEICMAADGNPWELGRGAMGITYRATDTHLNCAVALKIINARRLGGATARDRFLREARTAACLRHPNIASVFHLGLGEDDCFYAMEYIEGETIETRINRDGAMPWRLALNIVSQSARALRIAHAQHFIHRDIKPTNIMLIANEHRSDEDVSVKLIDFGLVKALTEDAVGDSVCESYFAGTPHYASPEQIKFGTVDARSDIYSLGRCLAYMLTGNVPQASSHPFSSERQTQTVSLAEAEIPENIPTTIVTLLKSMVADDPSLRPQSANDLLQRIADCHETLNFRAKYNAPVGDDAQFSATGKNGKDRNALRLLEALGTTALVAIGIAFWLIGRSHRESESIQQSSVFAEESRALCVRATEFYQKYTREDNQRAIELYSKSIALSPAYTEPYWLLASAYHENVTRYSAPKEQLELGIACAQRAIALNPNSPKAFQVLGAIRSFQGQHWEALEHLHRALELDPKSAPAMCDFSLQWICVGEPQLALPWAMAAASIEPSKIQGWHAAAEASIELGADERAEEYYARCSTLKPVWMSAYCGLLHIHLLQGNFAKARQDFAKANSIQSGLIFPLTLQAQIALFNGDYVEAEKHYRHLLTMNRGGMVRYYSGISYLSVLGFLRLQAGDAMEGNALLDEAAKLHSANSEGSEDVYDLAAIRAVQQRTEDALTLLDQAINSGWNDYRATQLDPRFNNLRDQPQFQKMLADSKLRVQQMRIKAEILCANPVKLADYPVRPTRK